MLTKEVHVERRKQSTGQCLYCGQIQSKSRILKHLKECDQRQIALAKAASSKVATIQLHHLRVQAEGIPMFWLDIEMRGSATLSNLDTYLRAIWLECCGHMSQFSFGGWLGDEISMRRSIDDVFQPEVELTHIYDFGTSSVTLIKSLSTHKGKPTTSKPIALLARNVMPETTCIMCGKTAAWVCLECQEEDQTDGTLCDVHAESHPHDQYGEPMPLVNSPRAGMCGYEGPAVPPY